MDQARKTELRVGIVSLLAIIVLVGGIFLGEGLSLGSSKQILHVRLDHSGGLTKSSPVVVNGVTRGTVTKVRSDNGSVLVDLEIDTHEDLHPDAHALVSILEITGGKKVEIFPGTTSGMFDPSLEIPGRAAADIGGLITQIGDVSGDLITMLRRIDTITAAIAVVMADSSFAPNVQSLVSDGASLMKNAREWVEQNRGELSKTVTDTRILVADLKSAVEVNDPKLRSLLDKLDSRLDDIQTTIHRTDTAIVHVDDLVVSVQGLVNDVKTNDGFANAVLYDKSFRLKMDTIAARVRQLSESLILHGVNVNVGIGHHKP